MKNLSILHFDPRATKDASILDLLWNLAGIPDLEHQLLLTIFELIIFLHSDLHDSLAIIVSSYHFGILQWKCIKEIEETFPVVHQNVQISCLNHQLLGLVILQEVLITIDEDVAKVWMELGYFLQSTVFKASDQWMLVQSIVFFDDSILDVLLWFTNEKFQEISNTVFLILGFFLLQQLEVVALLRVLVVLDEH